MTTRSALTLCALLLGGIAGKALVAPPAWAESARVFQELGLIELLRPTDLVGDGATPVDLWLLALDAGGKPISGWKVKLTASGGTAGELVDAGGGLYRFPFTPAKTDTATTASVELRGKLPTRENFVRTWSFPVAPPRGHSLQVAANPAQLTLGTDKTANLSFTVSGGDAAALTTVELLHAVSAGTLGALTNLGGGRFDGLYTAPTGTTPQVALLTVVDAADASGTYAGLALPLSAKLDQAVTVAPNAKVLLKLGGRDFGPVAADGKGRAKVPVVVPPGVRTATRVEVTPDGTIKEGPMDLAVPETRRIALFPTAASLPADGRVKVVVRAMVVTPDGRPDEAAQVAFAATAGTVHAPRHEGGGVYVAAWTPPFGNVLTKATISAKLADQAPVQADTRPVSLVPVRPTAITLTPEPATLPVEATSFSVLARVQGPDGAALPGRTLVFAANGARLQGVQDLKDGTYRATFATTGKGPVEVTARASTPSLGNPLSRLVLVPSREVLPPDGLSSSMVTVAALDEYGYPVPDAEVSLRLLSGDGSLPATARTNADGIAQVFYTAGRANGFVAIEASAGDRTAGVSLLQAPEGVAVPDLPVNGSAEAVELAKDVAGGVAAVRIDRGG